MHPPRPPGGSAWSAVRPRRRRRTAGRPPRCGAYPPPFAPTPGQTPRERQRATEEETRSGSDSPTTERLGHARAPPSAWGCGLVLRSRPPRRWRGRRSVPAPAAQAVAERPRPRGLAVSVREGAERPARASRVLCAERAARTPLPPPQRRFFPPSPPDPPLPPEVSRVARLTTAPVVLQGSRGSAAPLPVSGRRKVLAPPARDIRGSQGRPRGRSPGALFNGA